MNKLTVTLLALASIGGLVLYGLGYQLAGLIIIIFCVPVGYKFSEDQATSKSQAELSQSNLLPVLSEVHRLLLTDESNTTTEIAGARLQSILHDLKTLKKINSTMRPKSKYKVTLVDKWGGEWELDLLRNGERFEFSINQIFLGGRRINKAGKDIIGVR